MSEKEREKERERVRAREKERAQRQRERETERQRDGDRKSIINNIEKVRQERPGLLASSMHNNEEDVHSCLPRTRTYSTPSHPRA